MEMTAEYKTKEVEEILVAYQNIFMPPPKGYTWSAILWNYGGAQLGLKEEVRLKDLDNDTQRKNKGE